MQNFCRDLQRGIWRRGLREKLCAQVYATIREAAHRTNHVRWVVLERERNRERDWEENTRYSLYVGERYTFISTCFALALSLSNMRWLFLLFFISNMTHNINLALFPSLRSLRSDIRKGASQVIKNRCSPKGTQGRFDITLQTHYSFALRELTAHATATT